MSGPARLFTIGYEGATQAELIAATASALLTYLASKSEHSFSLSSELPSVPTVSSLSNLGLDRCRKTSRSLERGHTLVMVIRGDARRVS